MPPSETARCTRCDGCGQIASSDEGGPWTVWAELPPGSDLAVRMGIVYPLPCPACSSPVAVTPDEERDAIRSRETLPAIEVDAPAREESRERKVLRGLRDAICEVETTATHAKTVRLLGAMAQAGDLLEEPAAERLMDVCRLVDQRDEARDELRALRLALAQDKAEVRIAVVEAADAAIARWASEG